MHIKDSGGVLGILVSILLLFVIISSPTSAVTLHFASHPRETSDGRDAMKLLTERFNEMHPDIEVKYLLLRDIGWDALTVYLATGMLDVVQYWQFRDWIEEGYILNLNRFIDDNYFADFYQAQLDFFSKDGDLYAIPMYLAIPGQVYNKRLFDENGLICPGDQWDWDLFFSTTKKLTTVGADGSTSRYGYAMGSAAEAEFDLWLWSNGGRTVPNDEMMGTRLMWDEKAVEALDFLVDLSESNLIPRKHAGLGEFYKLEAAITAVHTGVLGWVMDQTPHFDWDVISWPRGPSGDSAAWVGLDGYAVIRNTEYPEEAIEFIQYLASPECQLFLMENAGLPPSRRTLAADYLVSSAPAQAGFSLEYFIGAMEYARPQTTWATPQVGTIMNQAIADVVYRLNRSAGQAVEETVRIVNTILERYNQE